jgi:hypothetical protein
MITHTPAQRIRQRNYPVYKYRELLAAVGNDTEIQDLIEELGFEPPPVATIRGWRTRNAIPGRWLPLLVARAVTLGRLPSISALIKGSQAVNASQAA